MAVVVSDRDRAATDLYRHATERRERQGLTSRAGVRDEEVKSCSRRPSATVSQEPETVSAEGGQLPIRLVVDPSDALVVHHAEPRQLRDESRQSITDAGRSRQLIVSPYLGVRGSDRYQ